MVEGRWEKREEKMNDCRRRWEEREEKIKEWRKQRDRTGK